MLSPKKTWEGFIGASFTTIISAYVVASMQTYVKGVLCPHIFSKNRLDHGVFLMGYGAAKYVPMRFKKSLTGSLRIHGEKAGEKMDTTSSA
ncbi:hypothetical protein ACET3Z_006257 [Daucus carota]